MHAKAHWLLFAHLLLVPQWVEADVVGTTTDFDIEFVSATCSAPLGNFAVDISLAAERAFVDAPMLQTKPLAFDENLVLNGVDILIAAGTTQNGVIDRINEFTEQTGVVAEINPVELVTRLRTVEFGASQCLSVVSDNQGPGSSGFLLTIITDVGLDVAGTIGSQPATGNGDLLTGWDIELRVRESIDPISTVSGSQGNVIISAVPEPGMGLVCGAVALAVAINRKRMQCRSS